MWRSGGVLPKPPRNLGQRARKLWLTLVHQRPADYWTPGALLLLDRLCRTAVSVEIAHGQLDKTPPGSPDASRLVRDLTTLNASIVGLSRQLRLAPQQTVTPHSTGRLTETAPSALDDPLLGGRAVGARH